MNILGLQITVQSGTARRTRLGRGIVALAAVNALVLAGGAAYAFWSTSGSGAGTAQARVFNTPTVTAGSAPAGQLYPGLTANGTSTGGDITVLVTNNNPFPVTITNVSAGTGTITATGGANATTCATSTGVSIFTKANPSVTGTIGANAVNAAVTIQFVVSMSTASDTGCQGATFGFPATGVSLTFTSA